MTGIDWEAQTGKPMDKITTDDRITVLVSVTDKLYSVMKPVAETYPEICKTVARHDFYWKIGIFVSSALALLVIGFLFNMITTR